MFALATMFEEMVDRRIDVTEKTRQDFVGVITAPGVNSMMIRKIQ